MRFAIVENGIVINVVESELPLDPSSIASDSANIGDIWDGNNFKIEDPNKKMQDKIASIRYMKEVKGIIVDGIKVNTDDRSKLLINGAALESIRDPSYLLRWKTSEGFIELNAEQVLLIACAVRRHVQSCFDRESELLDHLENNTFEETMLDEGWPS